MAWRRSNRLRSAAIGLGVGLSVAAVAAPPVDRGHDIVGHRPVRLSLPEALASDRAVLAAGSLVSLDLGGTIGTVGLIIERVHDEPTGRQISGTIDRGGTFSLGLAGEAVCGGLWMGQTVLALEPTTEAGVVAVRALDAARLVNCHDHATGLPALAKSDVSMGQAVLAARAEGAAHRAQRGATCADDPGTIDVLIVTTQLAVTAAGGLGAIQARALDFAAATGAAFASSDIPDLAVAIAGFETVAYDEAAPAWLDHLVRVTDPDDGILDQVHALRDQYRADTVMLVVDDPRFTGGAAWWAVWSEADAFSVMNWRELGGGHLTASHELGHNLGCAHDRDNDAAAPFDFSWGYRYDSGGTLYGTIMSIGPDVYIPHYANPHVLGPGGQPTGVGFDEPDTAYTAYTIARTRWTLANYRQSLRELDCNNNGIADAVEIAGGADDANGNGILDVCEERVLVDASAAVEGEGSSWAQARRDLHDVLEFASLRCHPASQVWVADGTYLPDATGADRWLRFSLRSGLAVLGGFQGQSHPAGGETDASERNPAAHQTTLSGDIGVSGDASDNSYSVVDAFEADITAVLDGVTVRDGSSFANAGGVFVFEGGATLRQCRFLDNHAPGSGGGVGIFGPGLVLIEECVFTGNSAGFVGGAVALWDGAEAQIVQSTFATNTADFGGAIGIQNTSSAMLAQCSLDGNSADLSGGAIETFGASTLTVHDSAFVANHALDGAGGAISIGGASQATIERTTFEQGTATWVGGAIACDSSAMVIEDVAILNNEGEYGGGLALSFAEATLNRVRIEANRARQSGAGIDVFAGSLDAVNTLIARNEADNNGGGIAFGAGTAPGLVNCTIAENVAANLGGGIATADANVIIVSTVAWGNTAGFGSAQEQQVFVFSSPPNVRYCIIEGWSGGGTGNQASDPQFVDASGGDYRLLLSSPAIDAGSNPDLPAMFAATDLAGEARLVDVASVVDTGVGPAPVVDIGAFEFQPADCLADWDDSGVLDFFDILGFLADFSAMNPNADVNNDQAFDFFDLIVFLGAFSTGCP